MTTPVAAQTASSVTAAELPWLTEPLQRARAAFDGQRAPHSLLVCGQSGAGLEAFTAWLVGYLHCDKRSRAPCGECRACRWLASAAFPDHQLIEPLEDSAEIRVDQIRELIEQLSLTAHGSGRRSVLLQPAERLNRNAANSLLKLLEEPPPRSTLVLATGSPSRLPATIRSRCLRIDLPTPSLGESARWLAERTGGHESSWRQVLTLAGNTPVAACRWDFTQTQAAIAALERDLGALAAGEREPVLLARQWDDERYEQRLLELENLITKTLLQSAGTGPRPLLSTSEMPKLRSMFELLDRIREDRRLADSPVNRQHGLTVLLAAAQGALRGAQS